MRGSLESIIKHMIKLNNHKSNISFPAIVVNTDNLADGFIDVKPLVNNMNSVTGETIEYPPIRNVQVLMPSSKSSSISFPIVQGDTVDLLFQSVDIVDFVNGEKEAHDPFGNGWGNLANVVALVGFTPYQESPFNPNNYSNDFNNQDLNIVHNKNSSLESSMNISASGSILQKAPNAVTVDSPLFDVKSDLLNANNAVITTGGDVVVQGQSLNQFMLDAPLNLKGSDGDRGWSPVLAVENRGQEDAVLRLTDWVGGEGDKPSEQGYIGSNGLVSDILDAINIRGARGKSGAALSADTIQDIVNSQFTVGAILDLIQGQIDESALTKSLTSKIDKIEYNELAISQETQARIDSILDTNSQISIEREQRIFDVTSLKDGISTEVTQRKEADVSINSRVDSIVTKSDGNTAAIQQEATSRIEADTAIGSRIDTIVSDVDNNTAAIVSESTTRADEDSALSTRIETVLSKTDTNTATITSLQETLTDELGSQAERIETMQADYKPRYADKTRFASSSRSTQWTYWKTVARDGYTTNERIEQLKSDVGKNNASITESLNTLVTMDESLASSINNLRSNTEGSISAINTELSATTAKTNATASSVSTLQTTVAGNTASIQVAQNSIDGINLQYTVKLDSGGKISGFGMMNDGATSAFDIRADRFTISPPANGVDDGKSPFMVLTTPTNIDGVTVPAGTYIRGSLLASGTITGDKIRSNTSITAPNIIGGNINIGNGNFTVNSSGSLYAESGTFKGTVLAEKISGTIDVASMKKSAWTAGYDVYIKNDSFGSMLPSDFNANDRALATSHAGYGSINWFVSQHNTAVTMTLFEIRVEVLKPTVVYQKIFGIDDSLSIHVNGVVVRNRSSTLGNISYNLPVGSSVLIQYLLVNNNGGATSATIAGNFIDNVNVKFA